MWLAEDGPCMDPTSATGLGDTSPWLTTSQTAFGELSHMTPVTQLSKTPGRWRLPVAPLGTHDAAWLGT
jgi:hypothetical protein